MAEVGGVVQGWTGGIVTTHTYLQSLLLMATIVGGIVAAGALQIKAMESGTVLWWGAYLTYMILVLARVHVWIYRNDK